MLLIDKNGKVNIGEVIAFIGMACGILLILSGIGVIH